MKNKKKLSKKILIVIIVIAVLLIGIFLLFNNKNKNMTLSCEGIKSDDQLKLTTNVLVEKKSKDIYVNYIGKLEFLVANEIAQKAMSVYVNNEVSKLKEINDNFATFEESERQIKYTFDFDMSSLSETKIKELLGIYSQDVEELQEHFENGGLICEVY